MKNLLVLTLAFSACAACGPGSERPATDGTVPDSTHATAQLNGWQVIPVRGGGQMEGSMRNGERHGPWVSRFPNGTLRSRTNYVNGVEDGAIEVFFGNNLTHYKGQHRQGKPYGEWVFNDTLGNEVKRVAYDVNGTVVRP